MCIEKRKGDRESQDSYAQQIRNRFPRSPEAQNLDGKDC
jgi:Tfp pilus assembly protein PilF